MRAPDVRCEVDSLDVTEQQSAANATKPRVTLDSIKAKIVSTSYLHPPNLPTMTIAVLMLENGFSVVGKSAPASPDNFNPELGRKFATEDAIRQAWQLEGYLLREQLFQQEKSK